MTGYVVDRATDIELPGLLPFAFRRFYSSGRHRDRRASLGRGWSHGLDRQVTVGERSISLTDEEGRFIHFEPVAVGESTFHRRERLTLKRDGELDFAVFDHRERTTARYRPVVPGGAAVIRSVEDAWGRSLSFEYEGGALSHVVDSAGRRIVARWRGGKLIRLEVVVDALVEQWVDYEYDEGGCLVAVVDALGHTDEYEYDAHGRMTAATIKTGPRFTYVYDGDSGRCIKTAGPKGLYGIELHYDDAARVTYVDGEESRIIEWDEEPGRARRERLPDGQLLEEIAYDADGYRIALANGAGEGRKWWFDARGNEIRRVDPAGATTTIEYDDRDLPVRRIDPDGAITELTHDARGSLTSLKEPSGRVLLYSYDDRGRLVGVQDEHGPLRIYEWDARDGLVAETDGRGARTTYTFDALGRVTGRTDAVGRSVRLDLDRLGRVTSTSRPDGTRVQRSFDALGKPVREVSEEGVTELAWSGMGRISKLVTTDGRSYTFAYTTMERLAKVTNPVGESYTFQYDTAGRVVEEKTFDGRKLIYRRGPSGRVEKIEYPDGSSRTFSYDRAGRVVEESGSDESKLSYRRDGAGRILEATIQSNGERHTTLFERDALGRVVVERQGDRVLRFAFDEEWNRVERTGPFGELTRYAYDRQGGVTEIDHAGRVFSFERDLVGRERSLRDGRGAFSIETARDALDRIVSQRALGAPGGEVPDVLVDRRFGYDRAGRVTSIEDATWGRTEIGYDKLGMVAFHAHHGAAGSAIAKWRETFEYDPAGSLAQAVRTLESDRAPKTSARRWKLGPGGVAAETEAVAYVYDARRRRTAKRDKKTGAVTSYVWDVRDRLREVVLPDGSRVKMSYDAFGRRVRKELRSQRANKPIVTEWVWDRSVVCAELSPALGPRSFVHHPQSDVPLLQSEKGETFLVIADQVGVPRELIDGAGRVAWRRLPRAFGAAADEQWDTLGEQNRGYRVRSPFGLLGQLEDADIELAVTHFRVFDPETGRFMSPDPLGVVAGFRAFCFDGAPTVSVDPLGLSTQGGNHDHGGDDARPQIEEGKQGKHVPGHNNFDPSRSPLTHPDPQALLDSHAGTGQQIGATPVGQPGSKERVDFGTPIGEHRDASTGTSTPTTVGIIHYSKNGAHIVPARPAGSGGSGGSGDSGGST